jgi:hypothetical protein
MTSGAREKKAKIWARDPHDWYQEPPSATEALLGVERFVGKIWDPACGGGNICDVMDQRGHIVAGTDILCRVENKPWWKGEQDFREAKHTLAPNVVCNPPFFRAKGTEAFIRKALELATGKVAMFVDMRFIAGAERANGLFAQHPPHRIWIVTPRVSCPPGHYLAAGNKAGGGTAEWVWLIWDQTSPRAGLPQLGWLRKEAA